ncbi:MFS transporter, partial [Salmonella enterica subsp. enterica serovar Typhimurium]
DDELPQETLFLQLFNRRHFPFVLFVAAIWTCQLIPMFALYTLGPQFVRLLGWEQGRNAALGNVLISFSSMLGCLPLLFCLHCLFRRPLLIGSVAMMTI